MTATDHSWLAAEIAVLLRGGNPRSVRQRANARGISPEHVQHACERSLDTPMESEDALLPFRRWEAPPPGCLDVRVLDQHEYWIDALCIRISSATAGTCPTVTCVVKQVFGVSDKEFRSARAS